MASLRKKPGSVKWFACFTLPDGKRVQRSTKETSRKKAQEKADLWEALSKNRAKAKQAHRVIADIYRAANQSELPSANARAFLEGYVARRKTETSKSTYDAYKNRVKGFLAFLGPRAESPLTDITREDVQRYRDQELKRVSPATVNMGVKVLRVMFEDARRDSLIADNPAKEVRALKTGNGTRRAFTIDELRAVLKLADDEWRSMIFFGLYTGQRLGDIAMLNWQNVDLVANDIRLVTGKTGRIVSIPICPPLKKHIEENLSAGDDPKAPLHAKAFAAVELQGRAVTLSTQFGDLLSQAGLAAERRHKAREGGKGRSARRASSELSFHSLRHTATSLMKNAGISSAVVQDIIGHDSAEVSAHYTHIDSEAKRKALESMPDLTN